MALDNKAGKIAITFFKNNLLSVFALIVSVTSAYVSTKSSRDTITQRTIDNTYANFYDISVTGMSNSDLMHLITVSENYDMVQKDIHLSLMPISEQKRAVYILIAAYLFGFYENTLFQYNESVKSRNKGRTHFLKSTLDYFRLRVLRNPRLLYLWDKAGGNLSINYAKETLEDYDQNVLNYKDGSLTINIDSVGPYFIDHN